MIKSLIFIIFILFPVLVFSQYEDDEDSAYYEDDFVKDTTSTFHIGFIGGGLVQSVFFTENTDSDFSDSIEYQNSTPQSGFTLGLLIDKDISDKLWFRTGLLVSVSKLNMNYNFRTANNYTFNHSSLELPLWFQYAFKDLRKGISWGAGIKGSLDISRSEDRGNRLFEMKRAELLIGSGPTMRWQMGSGNLVNLSLGFNVSIFNLFADNSSIYNQTISSGRRWQIQLLLAIN